MWWMEIMSSWWFIYKYMHYFLAQFFSYEIILRLLIFLPIILWNFLWSYLLVKYITKSNLWWIFWAIVFWFNTYILIGQTGQLTLSAAFALWNFLIYFFLKLIDNKEFIVKDFIYTIFLAILVWYYEFRSFYIISFILFFYVIFKSILLIKQKEYKYFFSILKRFFWLYFFVLLFNLFWLVPFIKAETLSNNDTLWRPLFWNQYMNILQSFTLFHPFWSLKWVTVFHVNLIPLYQWLIPILWLLGFTLWYKKNNKIFFFFLILLLGIFLSKQVWKPFSHAYEWLYKNFPWFSAFRESSKFFYIVALWYSVLIWNLVSTLYDKYKKNNNIIKLNIILIIILTVFFINLIPFNTWKISWLFHKRYIDKDYLIFKNFILKNKWNYKIFWMPRYSRWWYYDLNKPFISAETIINHNWKKIFSYKDYRWWAMKDQLLDIIKQNFSNDLFDNSWIKYVVVPLEDKINDDNFFIYYWWNRDIYIEELKKLKWLKQIDLWTKDLILFENKWYKKLFFSNKLKDEQLQYNINDWWSYFIKIDKLHNKDITLYFWTKYNSNWKLYLWKLNYKTIFNNNWLVKDKKTNYNLNSWTISKQEIIDYVNKYYWEELKKEWYPKKLENWQLDYKYYKLNPDWSINVELTLYFKPQLYFYIWLIISWTTFLLLILWLIVDSVKERRKKLKKDLNK